MESSGIQSILDNINTSEVEHDYSILFTLHERIEVVSDRNYVLKFRVYNINGVSCPLDTYTYHRHYNTKVSDIMCPIDNFPVSETGTRKDIRVYNDALACMLMKRHNTAMRNLGILILEKYIEHNFK